MTVRQILLIIFLPVLVVAVMADDLYLPFNIDFEQQYDDPSQFHVKSRVLNTPVLRFFTHQGTNSFNPIGHEAVFRYGKDISSSNMVTITGACFQTYVDFKVKTNDFSRVVSDWYAEVILYRSVSNDTYSYAAGSIDIGMSPGIDASGLLAYTYAINGSAYGPFTGSFDHWPFMLKSTFSSSGLVTSADLGVFSNTVYSYVDTAVSNEAVIRSVSDAALSNQLVATSNSLAAAISAMPGAVAVNTNALIAGIDANSNAIAAETSARIVADSNKVSRSGDTITGQLTVTTNLSINAGGTQWYMGSAPGQLWFADGQFGEWFGGMIFDTTNYDLTIPGAFIGSAAKLTDFPDTLATATQFSAETNARIAADTALSNGLAGVGAGATSLVSAAKTDASNQFVNVGGDTMTGPLVASNIYSVGAMKISADSVLTLSGGDGVVVQDPITFEEPLTGVGSGLSGIPISGVSGLSTALASKVSSVAMLPTLTVGDLSSVGTNLCTGFTVQTGTLGGVKITNIYATITAGKTYAFGLGLESTYLGTSWLSCAGFTLTNGTPGSRASNYFSLATSTDRVVLTISSVAGMAQIVTNVYVGEVRTGTVWIASDVHAGGDVLSANYGHDMPLLTNETDVCLGARANANNSGLAIGTEANGTNYAVAIGSYSEGFSYGSSVGMSSHGYDFGSAVGYCANGYSSGVGVGASSFGHTYGVAVGRASSGHTYGSSVGANSYGYLYGSAFGYGSVGHSLGVAVGREANGSKTNIAIGVRSDSQGGSERISIGHNVTNAIDNSAALRGTLYLDGGTGILYRSTFGTGAWTLLESGGALGITNVVPTNASAGVATISGSTLAIGTNIPPAGAESDPVWLAQKAGYATLTQLDGVSNAIIKGATISAAAADAVTTNTGILTITWNTNAAHDGTSAGGSTRTNTWDAVGAIQQDAGATCWVVRGLPVQLVVASNSPTTIATSITDTNIDTTTWLQIRAGTNIIAWGSGVQSTGIGAHTTYVGRADTTVILLKPAYTNLSQMYQLR